MLYTTIILDTLDSLHIELSNRNEIYCQNLLSELSAVEGKLTLNQQKSRIDDFVNPIPAGGGGDQFAPPPL